MEGSYRSKYNDDTNIDSRIIAIEFKNKDFEKNVQDTLDTLKKLNKSLDNIPESSKAFDNMAKSIDKINLENISNNLKDINEKINLTGIIGKRITENLTDSVMSLGKSLLVNILQPLDKLNAFSFKNISEGFRQYQDVNNSIRTIMDATGESIDLVTEKFKRLEWFSSETNYSIKAMGETVQSFTNAGAELDEAIDAIMGIGDWGASAGKTAAEVQYAFEAMSKAMGTGYVNMQQWATINLSAKMGTKEFKQMAIDIAEAYGYLQKIGEDAWISTESNKKNPPIVNATNFNLSDRWFKKDVLTEVLREYSQFSQVVYQTQVGMEELDEQGIKLIDTEITAQAVMEEVKNKTDAARESLKQYGYTAEEAEDMLNSFSELAVKAFEAGQKARTFEQAVETGTTNIKNAWAKLFKSIFGNVEEAEKLFTALAQDFYELFATGIENIANFFEPLKENGSITLFFTGIYNILQNIVGTIESFKKGFSEAFGLFTSNEETLNAWGEAMYAFATFTQKLVLNENALKGIAEIGRTFGIILKDIFSILGIGIKLATPFIQVVLKIAGLTLGLIGNVLVAMEPVLNIITKIINSISAGLEKVVKFLNFFIEIIFAIIDSTIVTAISKIAESINTIVNLFSLLPSIFAEDGKNIINGLVEGILGGVINLINTIKNIGTTIIDTFKNVLGIHSPSIIMEDIGIFLLKGLFKGLMTTGLVVGSITLFSDWLLNTLNKSLGISSPSKKTEKTGVFLIAGLFQGIKKTLLSGLKSINDSILKFLNNIGIFIGKNGAPIINGIKTLFSTIVNFIRIGIAGLFNGISTVIIVLPKLISKYIIEPFNKALPIIKSTLAYWGKQVLLLIGNVINAIINGIKNIPNLLKTFFNKIKEFMLGPGYTVFGPIIEGLKGIKRFLTTIRDYFKNIFIKVLDEIKKFADTTYGKVILITGTILLIYGAIKYLTDWISYGLFGPFVDMAYEMQKTAVAMRLSMFSETFKDLSFGISALLLSISAVGLLLKDAPEIIDNVRDMVGTVSLSLLVLMTALIVLTQAMNDTATKYKFLNLAGLNLLASFTGMGILLLALSAATILISKFVDVETVRKLSNIFIDTMIAICGIIIVSYTIMSLINSKVSSFQDSINAFTSILKAWGDAMIPSLLSFALILFGIQFVDVDKLFGAAIIVVGAISALLLITKYVSAKKGGWGKNQLQAINNFGTFIGSIGKGILSMVASIALLSLLIDKNDFWGSIGKIALLGGILITMIGVIELVTLGISKLIGGKGLPGDKEMKGISSFITSIGTFMRSYASVMALMMLMPKDKILIASTGILIALGGLSLTMLAISKMQKTIGGAFSNIANIAAICGLLFTLTWSLTEIAKYSQQLSKANETLKIMFIGINAIALILGIFSDYSDVQNQLVIILGLVGTTYMIGESLSKIGPFGEQLDKAKWAILIMFSCIAAIEGLIVLAANFLKDPITLGVALGLNLLVDLLMLAFGKMAEMVGGGIKQGIDSLTSFLNTLSTTIPLLEGKEKIIDALRISLEKLINSLSLVNIVDTEKVNQLFYAFTSDLFNIGKDAGANFIDGFIKGIDESKSILTESLDKVTLYINTQFKKGLAIASPSKIAYADGKYYFEGFIDGMWASHIELTEDQIGRISEEINKTLKENSVFETEDTGLMSEILGHGLNVTRYKNYAKTKDNYIDANSSFADILKYEDQGLYNWQPISNPNKFEDKIATISNATRKIASNSNAELKIEKKEQKENEKERKENEGQNKTNALINFAGKIGSYVSTFATGGLFGIAKEKILGEGGILKKYVNEENMTDGLKTLNTNVLSNVGDYLNELLHKTPLGNIFDIVTGKIQNGGADPDKRQGLSDKELNSIANKIASLSGSTLSGDQGQYNPRLTKKELFDQQKDQQKGQQIMLDGLKELANRGVSKETLQNVLDDTTGVLLNTLINMNNKELKAYEDGQNAIEDSIKNNTNIAKSLIEGAPINANIQVDPNNLGGKSEGPGIDLNHEGKMLDSSQVIIASDSVGSKARIAAKKIIKSLDVSEDNLDYLIDNLTQEDMEEFLRVKSKHDNFGIDSLSNKEADLYNYIYDIANGEDPRDIGEQSDESQIAEDENTFIKENVPNLVSQGILMAGDQSNKNNANIIPTVYGENQLNSQKTIANSREIKISPILDTQKMSDSIENMMPSVVPAFIESVIDYIPQIFDALEEPLIRASIKTSNAIINNSEFRSAILEIGTQIVAGIVSGMNSDEAEGEIESGVGEISKATIYAMESDGPGFGISSPSKKVAKKIGIYLPAGLAKGMLENTKPIIEASHVITKKTINALEDSIIKATDDAYTDLYTPVISKGIETYTMPNNLFTKSRINSIQSNRIQNGGENGNNSNINSNNYYFNQYNNSPKALTTTEIYRQTNNLISRMKGVIDKA